VWDRGSISYSVLVVDSSILGDGVPIWWQGSDHEIFAKASVTMASPTTASQIFSTTIAQASYTSSISSPTTSTTQTRASLPDGLSKGARKGIGVDTSLFVLIGLTLCFFFIRSRRKHGHDSLGTVNDVDPCRAAAMHYGMDSSSQRHKFDAPNQARELLAQPEL